ncbi:hypothetical protein, partial [Pseudokineococcus marinus]|uniref:hypothetical protein n=1 Tax=Pseudokineococcus marinus TaxID=351215 RepID=UPI0031DC4CCD
DRPAAAAFRRAVDVASRSAAAAAAVEEAEEAAAVAAASGLGAGATGTEGAPRARRVLVHASGFRQSPYSDVGPPGGDVRDTRGMARGGRPGGAARGPADSARAVQDRAAQDRAAQDRAAQDRGAAGAPRKLWHSSSGSSGR